MGGEGAVVTSAPTGVIFNADPNDSDPACEFKTSTQNVVSEDSLQRDARTEKIEKWLLDSSNISFPSLEVRNKVNLCANLNLSSNPNPRPSLSHSQTPGPSFGLIIVLKFVSCSMSLF